MPAGLEGVLEEPCGTSVPEVQGCRDGTRISVGTSDRTREDWPRLKDKTVSHSTRSGLTPRGQKSQERTFVLFV